MRDTKTTSEFSLSPLGTLQDDISDLDKSKFRKTRSKSLITNIVEENTLEDVPHQYMWFLLMKGNK